MGVVTANDVMVDVGLALLEPLTVTTLGTAVLAGVATVTPASMVGIYPGAILAVGANGAVNQEAVAVTSVTSTTFTATFVNAHANTDPVVGMTFSSGIPESTLFSQAEVLGYMTDAQKDFIVKVRPIYAVGTVALTVGKKVYPAPADSVRVERASIVDVANGNARELYDVTQADLDLMLYSWEASSGPSSWYQDQINTQTIGFGPPPQVGNTVTLFYSQCPPASLGILSKFAIPDPMTVGIKWRTLAVCFSKDGEMRDAKRAKFAQELYDMIVEMSKKFLAGTDARMKSAEETVEPLSAARL